MSLLGSRKRDLRWRFVKAVAMKKSLSVKKRKAISVNKLNFKPDRQVFVGAQVLRVTGIIT